MAFRGAVLLVGATIVWFKLLLSLRFFSVNPIFLQGFPEITVIVKVSGRRKQKKHIF